MHYPHAHAAPESTESHFYKATPLFPDAIAITAEELREALRIDAGSLPDARADELILTAQKWAENYAGFVLFNTLFVTTRNCFPDAGFQLQRYPVYGDVSLFYYVENLKTEFPRERLITAPRNFATLLFLKEYQCWPVNVDRQADAIEIEFNAGFGANADSLPRDIKAGIKALAVYLFDNPGDCSSGRMPFPAVAAQLLGFRKSLRV